MKLFICVLSLFLMLSWASGRSKYSRMLNRIVNGMPIDIREAPWQVSLQRSSGHFCGGSILTSIFILTAAHCLQYDSPRDIKVRVGSSNQDKGGQLIKVFSYKLHPSFDVATMSNDIGILQLTKEIKYSESAKPISMEVKIPKNGDGVYVTGWGVLQSGDLQIPEVLRQARLNFMDRKSCMANSKFDSKMQILKGMVCAEIDGKDACQGDSGGPLVAKGRLVGVISWGYGCASPGYPGVYADVSYYHDWILKQIADGYLKNN